MAARSAILNVMTRAAEKAGKAILRDFGEVEHLQVSRKGPADFVSAADQKAERIVREELQKARPDFGFLMEETGEIIGKDTSHRFIVDPLDGTTNFLHGVPHWAISIGLEREGEIIAGVVYEPVHDQMFWAEKGAGAFLNHQRLRVSNRRVMADALIATGIPFKGHGNAKEFLVQLEALMGQISGIRRFGAASLDLAYTAAGRFDGFFEADLKPWDLAAGMLMVTEAGGFVSEIGQGKSPLTSGSILAANANLHSHLAVVLRNAGKPKAPAPAAQK
ncbi:MULTISPECIES: inositol monophosphatase family protein [unclassified Azospirillum]|uniref:inositol monophosphatase family protein n=1 Tax=unclassified Azospirillum TaxID=2630922 RepID=UPI000B6CACD1|nr:MULTISPECIES: inositol monophosphatase family protein [unclassified Azospirillum]SNS24681.1 myo-inositol-1(or 4)-monophosphatase [Azospirillum sp. RU38E]SNS43143.1 myo-inositol-1(or 4)-monophosphatase [Azospirillum sp. RU37A]